MHDDFPKSSPGRLDNLQHMLRALKGRNYSLFFTGQGISVIGTWMQGTALSWLVYRLTDSELMLGVVGFASMIFSFIVSPIAGVLTDRYDRRRMLTITQILSMLQAGLLAALTLSGAIEVWHIIALASMLGLINSVDIPNRQAFMVDAVADRRDLPNAIALNSFAFNGGRLIGPPLAGLIIWAWNEGGCFLINSVSYIAVIGSLMAMRLPERANNNNNRKHILRELHDGWRYVTGSPPIRAILLLLGFIAFVGMPYGTLIPVFARDVLHGDAMTQGLIIAAAGIGAIIGAIYLASRRSIHGLSNVVAYAPAVLGLGLIVLGLSSVLPLTLATMVLAGFGMMVQNAGSNTILQTIVDDDKRGRVMSFYTIALMGTVPFGSLAVGALANKLGAPNTMLITGTICIFASAIFISRLPALGRHITPLYVKMGIISDTPPIPKDAAREDINGRP